MEKFGVIVLLKLTLMWERSHGYDKLYSLCLFSYLYFCAKNPPTFLYMNFCQANAENCVQ